MIMPPTKLASANTVGAVVVAIFTIAATAPAWSQTGARLWDGPGGTTCRLISTTAGIPWQHNAGDWRDAGGIAQGNTPFSIAKVASAAPSPLFSLDVTEVVRSSIAKRQRSTGILLRRSGGGETLVLHSREATQQVLRPALILKLKAGSSLQIAPEADTTLDCSTYTSLGTTPSLMLDGRANAAISFALPPRINASDVISANLWLAVKSVYGAALDVGAFELALPGSDPGPSYPGIAARYREDIGLEKDPAVLFTEGFETPLWRLHWGKRLIPAIQLALSSGNAAWLMWGIPFYRGSFDVVKADPALGFEGLAGNALRVTIRKGQQLGIDLRYYFGDHLGYEPEAVYMRYYLRFGEDWEPVDGGKLPGLAGTYGRAGWGGRWVDGTNGWSMRGYFGAPGKGDEYEGMTPVGSYAYVADTEPSREALWSWHYAGLGLLRKNRWYCIEQYVKLNTIGNRDGEFRAWIDGHLAYEAKPLHFRDTNDLKIETAWFNVFYGGLGPTGKDLHLYIDNIAIAKSYIGPMGR